MKSSYMFLLLSLMVGSSALANAKPINERYFFDQLEEVKRFSLFSANSWYPLDQQSLIVRTTPSKSYLLVLDRSLRGLKSGSHLHITSNGGTVFAGFDRVRSTAIGGVKLPGRIVKIYQLKGKVQRDMVRDRIKQHASYELTVPL